ncbi:hypothetical protein ACFQZJ_15165 [Maribacter chungangensis]|uniref:Uncharacterized protein n=1 Tax=Maribacter chungangensis TaxID=1069117 RepID=A0ABW3B6V0_9FLAO
MIDRLHFINQELWWAVILLAVAMVLLFVWKEWRGEFHTRVLVNSFVAFLGITALVLLYLRPTLLTEVSGKAMVLTDNYRVAQLDSIKDTEKSIRTIRYRPGLDFSKALDSINEIIVLGDGLQDFDFWQLKDVSVSYLKGVDPKGIVKLKYGNTLRTGQDVLVSGLFNQPVIGNLLVLETPGGEGLDSIRLNDGAEQGFTLRGSVKTKGKFVYRLSEKDSTGAVLNSDPVPVEVLAKKRLRMFISNRFPSFESKYLKNFLAEEGHEVVVRSQMTKGKYKFEYFNTEQSPVYGFREKELNDFDLVVLDTDTYLGLSKTSKDVLIKLTREKGLGIFVQPNETLFRSNGLLVNFDMERDASRKNVRIETGMVETYPYNFRKTDPRGVAVENHSYALAEGKGLVGTTILNNTYQLMLDGKRNAYQNIWTDIINTMAKSKEVTGTFEKLSTFSFVHRPISFSLRTGTSKPKVAVNASYNIPLIKNALIKDKWHGRTYPKSKGWHTLRMEGDTSVTAHYYVMDTIHWKAATAADNILKNNRFFNSVAHTAVQKTIPSEISRWWFFLIFLGCMGYLWGSPKLKA